MRNLFKAWMKTIACLVAFGSALPSLAAGISGQGTWESTLLGRDLYGNAVAGNSGSAVFLYDTALNITWLRNANVNGQMTWNESVAWAAGLSIGGFGGWRLPTLPGIARATCIWGYDGTNCGYSVQTKAGGTVFSEMAHLYLVGLGNKGYYDKSGNVVLSGAGLTNTGDFQGLLSYAYWLGAEDANDPGNVAWFFNTYQGYQDVGDKPKLYYALAVRSGDVLAAPVPEPHAVVMLLAGLAVVGVAGRRRRGQAAGKA